MKKLMIAAAVAAMGAAAFADCTPPAPEQVEVARVYDIKLNVKTTKGVVSSWSKGNGSQCAPGTLSGCTVYRAKDTTTIKGYVYICGNPCELTDYHDAMWDSKRKGYFGNWVQDANSLTWNFVNVIGKKQTDAEASWTFADTITYDEVRTADYALTGAGYGKFTKGYFHSFSGNFAGTVSQTFDHKTKWTEANKDCICLPSMVVKCDAEDVWVEATGSVAFGTWTMKYNKSLSKKYQQGWRPFN